MLLIPLFNVAVTLAGGLLHLAKSRELFARTCRLIRGRVDDFAFAGFLLQGLMAMAASSGDKIPEVAKQWFEGLQFDEGITRDVPISFVLPCHGDQRGQQSDVGVQLGNLISSWSGLLPSK